MQSATSVQRLQSAEVCEVAFSIIIPWRSGCPHREQAAEWVERRLGDQFPHASVKRGVLSPSEPWVKAEAVARVELTNEIAVIHDADVWTDGLSAAVEAIENGAPWAIPHDKLHRLSAEGTEAVLAGAPWQDQPLDQKPYRGIEGGGIIVAPREVIHAIPVDSRFTGWGQEDESHAVALHALLGPPWRGTADLIHLFHPPQPRMTRRRGSRESWELRKRYFSAKNDPAAMSRLIEEGRRDVSPASESSMHADPQLASVDH